MPYPVSRPPSSDLDARAPRPYAYVARAALVAASLLASAWLSAAGVTRCPSATLLHVACPGCGMTRALRLAVHGDVAASLAMNPLAVPVGLASAAVAVALVLVTFQRGSPLAILASRPARATLLAFLVFELLSVGAWALRLLGLLGGPVAM